MTALATESKKDKGALSAAAARIVQEALKPDVSVADLSRLALADPAFAARLLAVVNSASYGSKLRIASVPEAAARLGIRGLRNVALGLAVGGMAQRAPEARVLLANALRRAVAARGIAEALGMRDAETFFTTGLLLDVGLLRIGQRDLEAAVSVARLPSAQRVVLERARGRVSHVQEGAEFAQSLGLPPMVIDAIGQHHAPAMPEGDPALRIAWAAERVAAVFEGGSVDSLREQALEAITKLGGSQSSLDALLRDVPVHVVDFARALERDVGDQPDLDALVLDAQKGLVDLNAQYEELVRTLEAVLEDKERLAAELQRANMELAQQAASDGLTGLPNKRALEGALVRDLARADRDKTVLSLVVVDIDHFKGVNDTYGHSVGDVVLRAVGTLLQGALRKGDFVARYGGEEFVLILPATDTPQATLVADRLRARLAQAAIPYPGGTMTVTASFGVSSVRGPGCAGAAAELFERSDKALYVAKRAGRNCVRHLESNGNH